MCAAYWREHGLETRVARFHNIYGPFGTYDGGREKAPAAMCRKAAEVFDVNNDGKLDIVCGEYWYEAPDWTRHKICDVRAEGEYYDDFSDIPMDVNGDGFDDVIAGAQYNDMAGSAAGPVGGPRNP